MLHLEQIERDSYAQLLGLVTEHATTGMQLLVQYQDTYSNSYLCPFQLMCLVQLCDTMVKYNGTIGTAAQTIQFCLTCLEDAKAGYPVARALEKMFRNSLAEYRISIPDDVEAMVTQSDHLGPEELLDACTRATYKQPISQLLPQVQANAGQEFVTRWQQLFSHGRLSDGRSRASSAMRGSGKKVEIGSLLNP